VETTGLTDIGTLGGDFSWASDINSSGLVAGYSNIAGGDERAIAWSADGGLIDLGTLGRIPQQGPVRHRGWSDHRVSTS
jgi:probable HAF family extracellular repeat protein